MTGEVKKRCRPFSDRSRVRGYVAAIRAAQLEKVVLADRRS